jgi:hypothetical protein
MAPTSSRPYTGASAPPSTSFANDPAEGIVMQDIFSKDLVCEAKQHIKFLKELHKNGISTTTPSMESYRRYVNLWLPVVFRMRSIDHECKLIPPGDIAWFWHCHRLAPYHYLSYVQKRFFGKELQWSEGGKKLIREPPQNEFLDASHPFTFQLKDNSNNDALLPGDAAICNRTESAFHEMYPTESFFLPDCIPVSRSAVPPPLPGFDLMGSCIRQSSFLWQVSQPNFSDDAFIEQGVHNYFKFMRLMILKEHKFIVPTYQIDLIWHTHILSSIAQYHNSSMEINGVIMDHDDSLDDRTKGADLDRNFQATVQLWRKEYDEEYIVPGGVYRGEPTEDFFSSEHFNANSNVPVPAPREPSEILPVATPAAPNPPTPNSWMSIHELGAFLQGQSNENPMVRGYVSYCVSFSFVFCPFPLFPSI